MKPETALPLNRLYLAHSLSEPAFGATTESVFYVRMADGRRSVVCQSLATGLARVITTEPPPAGGVGYGGAIFAVRGDTLVYAAKDGKLHAIDLATGNQWAVTGAHEGVAAPAFSPCGRYVAYLAEQGETCNVFLAEVRGGAVEVKLSADPWYAFNPAFSPDGTRVAWLEWNERDMPWDESRIVIACFARGTRETERATDLLPLATTRIEKARVSYASPQFSPDGKHLAYTSDETGWRSLWVSGADGEQPARVDTGEGEVGEPDWVPGNIPVRWTDRGDSLLALRRHRGASTLLRVAYPGSQVTVIPTAWSDLHGLATRDGQVTLTASGPASSPVLVTIDLASGAAVPRATGGIGLLDSSILSTPTVISWKTVGGADCSGIFYTAVGPETAKPPRPVIVHIHGGPTSEVPLSWFPQAQYFATRGWHYLAVNHRGGTGYGRAFQDALLGQWGVCDVEDARSGAEHLVALGWADASRLVITGGSAGGYTTLAALTRDPDFWAAGISLFGIGNLYDLRVGSHRFEINYEMNLLGPLPESGLLWKDRSPLTHVRNVRSPVLLFHGTEDKAVPHQQSVEFAEGVRRNGVAADLVSYEGEGHGFVKEANRRDMIEKMERFLDKYVLCLQR